MDQPNLIARRTLEEDGLILQDSALVKLLQEQRQPQQPKCDGPETAGLPGFKRCNALSPDAVPVKRLKEGGGGASSPPWTVDGRAAPGPAPPPWPTRVTGTNSSSLLELLTTDTKKTKAVKPHLRNKAGSVLENLLVSGRDPLTGHDLQAYRASPIKALPAVSSSSALSLSSARPEVSGLSFTLQLILPICL